jgi:dihydroorotate dehydrogenase (fumarate)
MLHFYPPMEHAGPSEHLQDVREIRQSVRIPVLASLNAVTRDTWVEYAQRLEETGIDGLELNFYATPDGPDMAGAAIEEEQIATIAEIRQAVHLPIAIKLSPFYTNPLHLIHRLDGVGVNGFVLFNRLFQPEIDIHREQHMSPLNLSHAEDSRLPLRFAGLLHGDIRADVCSSTGIYSGGQIIAMVLAGAAAVQTVSSLYQNGLSHIATMLRDVEIWMEAKGYDRLSDFRGKLDQRHCDNPWIYTRAQYANLLMHPDEFVKNFPVI